MPPLTYSALDIITDAIIETGALAPGEVPSADEAQWGFRQLNYLLDHWAARRNFVYANTFASYTLVPNLSPHTIGPSGTFVVPQRPVKVVAATIILNNVNPNVEVPLTLRDSEWWMTEVTIKDLKTSQPTDLFYNPDFPNGSLYYWPVPDTAYGTRLELWNVFSQFQTINDAIGGPGGTTTLAPGYRNALEKSLAEVLLSSYKLPPNPLLLAQAAQARLTVFGNNSKPPRMATRDSGLPGPDNDLTQSNFNYKSRTFF